MLQVLQRPSDFSTLFYFAQKIYHPSVQNLTITGYIIRNGKEKKVTRSQKLKTTIHVVPNKEPTVNPTPQTIMGRNSEKNSP